MLGDRIDRWNRRYDALPEDARLAVAAAVVLPALPLLAAGPPWLGGIGLAWLLVVIHVRGRHLYRADRAAGCTHLESRMTPGPMHAREAPDDPAACPDVLSARGAGGGRGIPVRDGGSSDVGITHCPTCGRRLGPNPGGTHAE